MPDDKQTAELLEFTTTIVSAHVSHNAMSASDLPRLIATVHETLGTLGTEKTAEKPKPAVSIKKSVTPDYIVCLEDGKKQKMLKRHIKTSHNMTPEEYRQRWGLSSDYPMVTPIYSKQRSALAKKIGLGRKPGTKTKARRKA